MSARTDYPAPQIARDLGLSFRQIDYWTRKGYIAAGTPGSGNWREYPRDELAVLRRMALLVKAGLTAEAAARAARRMVERGSDGADLGWGVIVSVLPDTEDTASEGVAS